MTGIRLNHPLLLGALGGVLAACMACGILATAVAMLTPEPTPTPAPTAIIEPTPTTPPATPTITPVPTIVIQPTPTPAFSADEDAYVTSLREPIEQLANGLMDTARLLQNPLGTPQWRAELRQAIQQLTNAHYDATRLTPPASWAAFHNQLTQATYQCSRAGDMIYSAISDTSYTQMALVAMQRCTYLVADVSLELERRSRKP